MNVTYANEMTQLELNVYIVIAATLLLLLPILIKLDARRSPLSLYTASKVFWAALTRMKQKYIGTSRPFDQIFLNMCHPGSDDNDEIIPQVAAECPVYLALLSPALAGKRSKMFRYDCKDV